MFAVRPYEQIQIHFFIMFLYLYYACEYALSLPVEGLYQNSFCTTELLIFQKNNVAFLVYFFGYY